MTTRMSLKEAAELNPAKSQGPACTMGAALAEMDEAERALCEEWLAMTWQQMAATRLTRILTTAGYKVGKDAVARHRNGECGCRNG